MSEGELTLLMENMELKKRLIEEIQNTINVLNEKGVLIEQAIKRGEKTIIYLEKLDIALKALGQLRLKASPLDAKIIDDAMSKIMESNIPETK